MWPICCSASNVNILADPLTTLTDVDNPLTDPEDGPRGEARGELPEEDAADGQPLAQHDPGDQRGGKRQLAGLLQQQFQVTLAQLGGAGGAWLRTPRVVALQQCAHLAVERTHAELQRGRGRDHVVGLAGMQGAEAAPSRYADTDPTTRVLKFARLYCT